MSSKESRNPLVSIVVPTYNSEKYISKTLDSILSQTYFPKEIIVVDDDSSDRTREILNSYITKHNNIRVHVLNKNFGGPARPRNIGIMDAKGGYVAFLDSDDLWHPDKLKIQMDFLLVSDERAVCSSSIDFYFQDEISISNSISPSIIKLSYAQTQRKSMIPLSTLVIDTEVARQIMFNEAEEFIGREDYLFSLEYLSKYGIISKIEDSLMYYRKHQKQVSSNKFLMGFRQFKVLRYHYKKRNDHYSMIKITYYIINHIILSFYYRILLKKL